MTSQRSGREYQPPTPFEQAVHQIAQIESLYYLIEQEKALDFLRRQQAAALNLGRSAQQSAPPGIPVHGQVELGNPPETRGLYTEAWHGLGVVGLWAAIDAYCERVRHKSSEVQHALSGIIPEHYRDDLHAVWEELDDLRHLYAHNFASHADDLYFKRKRHTLAPGKSHIFKSGANFDGATDTVHINVDQLRFYCWPARYIVAVLATGWRARSDA